ncbi:hypothetical protein ACLB2K_029850 [Fragaria x ananassa]
MACSSSILVLFSSVLALALLSASTADNFLSIDCGSSESFTDKNSIKWVGDDDFIQNGKSQMVQIPNGVSQEMSTLRVFTTRKKNCYSIDAEKGAQFLVRGSFYYGNYDKKSAPPSFDVLLGQPGMANMPNGAQQGVQMMNGQISDMLGEVVMNQFEVNVEEQATPDYQQQPKINKPRQTFAIWQGVFSICSYNICVITSTWRVGENGMMPVSSWPIGVAYDDSVSLNFSNASLLPVALREE